MCCFCGRPLKPSEAVWLSDARVRCQSCGQAASAAVERERRNADRRVRDLHGRVGEARKRAPRQGYPYARHPRSPRTSSVTGRQSR